MSKYVIDTVELKKRQYVIEAFSEKEAVEALENVEPSITEIMSDNIFGIRTINEYEYKKDYRPSQKELFDHPWQKPGHPWNSARNPKHSPR